MKRFIALLLIGLGLSATVDAKPSTGGPGTIWQNYANLTNAPQVDATVFYNAGTIVLDDIFDFTNRNIESALFGFGAAAYNFTTKDTEFFTNAISGVLSGEPGFQFDTGLSTSRRMAKVFYNAGLVEALDTIAPLDLEVIPSAGGPINADNQPIPSQIIVNATNIINSGSMAVGDCGLLQQNGINVTNRYATLVAGAVANVSTSEIAINDELLANTALQGQDDWEAYAGTYYYVPSPNIYDLFWGVTNGVALDVSGIAGDLEALAEGEDSGLPPITTMGRDDELFTGFPLNVPNGPYQVTAVFYTVGTNSYYNIVMVNTNFADTNLTATVGFTFPEFPQDLLNLPTVPEEDAFEDIVQFAEPVYDVITGQTVTNGVYLIDDGAVTPVMAVAQNASSSDGYGRPNAFEVTTATPFNWADAVLEAQEFAAPYDPGAIYTADIFNNFTEPVEISQYGFQVGHNPSSLDGSFDTLVSEDFDLGFFDLFQVNLPDPTNQAARIEINAGNADMTQTRMRAEGMVVLNVTNLVGASTVAADFGEANLTIGATNGALVLSNMVPTTFKRVRGDIYAYSATWQNTQTNGVTNQWYVHILVVDQNLFGSFPTTVRNLTLNGKNSVVLQDGLNVIGSAVINTTNLTISSTNTFSQNAANFSESFAPNLKNLLVTSKGSLSSGNNLDIGLNLNQTQSSPTGRKYSVNTITNFGLISATSPGLQAAIFENDGEVAANNGGSMLIQANTLSLGLAVTNSTNFLFAGGNIILSGATIEASNSVITTGVTSEGSLTLTATSKLTDFVSSTPTTNTNSVIVNHWTVTGGFSMPVKPATGDLFGTEIRTVVTNFGEVTHIWAGKDMGATPAGFVNNAVIGHLVLDREASDTVLRFAAAGSANAMYVDYLELTNFAFSDYRHGLTIDPNFTIYFAACNFDPLKLTGVYPNMKWVQNFVGPNSTKVVPYLNSTNLCLMNTNLAESTEISFFNGLPNFYNQPYVLNNPSDPTQTYPCPGDETTSHSFLVATPTSGGDNALNLLNIGVTGQGNINPSLKTSQIVLGESYTLTAVPDRGWVFQSWSPTIGLNGVDTSSPVLKFNFVTNTLITANFIPNPFNTLKGTFNGLFIESAGVNSGSSGSFSLTLASSGAFSGHLLMGPSTYSFTGQFSGAGSAHVLARSGPHFLTVNLQLDMSGLNGQITGDVNGGTWDSPLLANAAPAWSAKDPSPLAGNYTMVLSGESATGGYATGSVSKFGDLTLAGKMADGASFTASAPVAASGQWPFYSYVPSAKDFVMGWISVGTNLTGTNITWTKQAGKTGLYPAGLTNVFEVVASPWQVPGKNSPALTLANPVAVLSGGDLSETLSEGVTLKNDLSFTATNLSLTISATTGSFTGWFNGPGTAKKQAVSGVVLQNIGEMRGFFQGANQSGLLQLQDQ